MSFSVAASDTENARPAFAGFGDVREGRHGQDELRQHLVGVEAVARVGGEVAVLVVEDVGFPLASTVEARDGDHAEVEPFVLPSSAAVMRIVAPVSSMRTSATSAKSRE